MVLIPLLGNDVEAINWTLMRAFMLVGKVGTSETVKHRKLSANGPRDRLLTMASALSMATAVASEAAMPSISNVACNPNVNPAMFKTDQVIRLDGDKLVLDFPYEKFMKVPTGVHNDRAMYKVMVDGFGPAGDGKHVFVYIEFGAFDGLVVKKILLNSHAGVLEAMKKDNRVFSKQVRVLLLTCLVILVCGQLSIPPCSGRVALRPMGHERLGLGMMSHTDVDRCPFPSIVETMGGDMDSCPFPSAH
jgi:hypothetical protein